eukprot:m.302331 g.302331  ORF g.302331 m.302331 type:complete len:64 (+) comp15124_c0_seq1:120-311(+)
MLPSAVFAVNRTKPRPRTFEVRVDGAPVVSLVELDSPFRELRCLDLDDIAAQVVERFERRGND